MTSYKGIVEGDWENRIWDVLRKINNVYLFDSKVRINADVRTIRLVCDNHNVLLCFDCHEDYEQFIMGKKLIIIMDNYETSEQIMRNILAQFEEKTYFLVD